MRDIGYIGKESKENRYFPNHLRFGIRDTSWSDQTGHRQPETQWVTCRAFQVFLLPSYLSTTSTLRNGFLHEWLVLDGPAHVLANHPLWIFGQT